MENERLVELFDKSFKGKFNDNTFNVAREELCQVLNTENLSEDDVNLHSFVKHFRSMRHKLEIAISYLEETSPYNRKFGNIIGKLINKHKLRVYRNIYGNMGRFSIEFMESTGISLVRVEDLIYYYGKNATV